MLSVKIHLLLNVIKDLPQLYLQGNKVEKKQILNLIGSNFTYKDKELSIVLNSVFDYLLNYPFSKNGGHEETRTPTLSH